jgi:hypothetical protein
MQTSGEDRSNGRMKEISSRSFLLNGIDGKIVEEINHLLWLTQRS